MADVGEIDGAVALKLAEKALDMAVHALARVEALEKSTHTVTYVDPMQGQGPGLTPVGAPMTDAQSRAEMERVLSGMGPEQFYDPDIDPMGEIEAEKTEETEEVAEE